MPYTINPKMPKVRREAVRLVKLKNWSIRKTARYLGYNPSTISRWVKKAPRDLRKTIPTKSSRPKTHPKALSREIVSKIIAKRLDHNRCSEVVHRELELSGIQVSLSSVKRTIDRAGLIRKKSPWKKWHFSLPRPEPQNKGDLLQLDTVHFHVSDGSRFYVYTIIDIYSRWAYAKVVKKISAGNSVKFLLEAKRKAGFRFRMVQTDHGPEFSSYFTNRARLRGILHRHSRVRKSNDNAHIERFNRTIQDECFGTQMPINFNRYLSLIDDYLDYYNNHRLHLGIGLKTPAQVLRSY
jgi:transposase InsO family protein